jgi:hypothetical protein
LTIATVTANDRIREIKSEDAQARERERQAQTQMAQATVVTPP